MSVDALHHLSLRDEDPYDYARAIRVFEEAKKVNISFDINVEEEHDEPFEVDVTDRHGACAVSLSFHHGQITMAGKPCGDYKVGQWRTVSIGIDGDGLKVNGVALAPLHAVKGVERLSFRTGRYRELPDRNTPNQEPAPPLPGCDKKVAPSRYLIDNVSIR